MSRQREIPNLVTAPQQQFVSQDAFVGGEAQGQAVAAGLHRSANLLTQLSNARFKAQQDIALNEASEHISTAIKASDTFVQNNSGTNKDGTHQFDSWHKGVGEIWDKAQEKVASIENESTRQQALRALQQRRQSYEVQLNRTYDGAIADEVRNSGKNRFSRALESGDIEEQELAEQQLSEYMSPADLDSFTTTTRSNFSYNDFQLRLQQARQSGDIGEMKKVAQAIDEDTNLAKNHQNILSTQAHSFVNKTTATILRNDRTIIRKAINGDYADVSELEADLQVMPHADETRELAILGMMDAEESIVADEMLHRDNVDSNGIADFRKENFVPNDLASASPEVVSANLEELFDKIDNTYSNRYLQSRLKLEAYTARVMGIPAEHHGTLERLGQIALFGGTITTEQDRFKQEALAPMATAILSGLDASRINDEELLDFTNLVESKIEYMFNSGETSTKARRELLVELQDATGKFVMKQRAQHSLYQKSNLSERTIGGIKIREINNGL